MYNVAHSFNKHKYLLKYNSLAVLSKEQMILRYDI